MFCPNCGKELPAGVKECPNCLAELEVQDTMPEEVVKEMPVEDMSVPEQPVEHTIYEGTADEAAYTVQETVQTENDPVGDFDRKPEGLEEAPDVSAQENNSETKKEAKDFSHIKNNLGKIVIGVTAIIALGVIGVAVEAGGAGKYEQVTLSDNFLLEADDDKLVSLNGDIVEVDEDIYNTYYSSDSSLTVVEDYEDTFYVATKKGLVEIDEEISNVTISTYGDTIAYMKEVEDGIGELYLYNVKSKKSTLIDDEAYAKMLILSPDGKTLAYVGNCEVDEGWYGDTVSGDLFISKNFKEGKKTYGDAMPLAVSNDAKRVFYIKDSEKLYMNEEKISSNLSYSYWFNADVSEMIFNEDGEANYFSAKKKESVRLKKDSLSRIVLPENTVSIVVSAGSYLATTCGVDTFNETIMMIDGTMYYMSKNGEELDKITGDALSYKMSNDGSGLMYLDKDGDLYYVKNVNKSTEAKKIAEDLEIEAFYTSSDLKKVYYVADDELFYLSGEKGNRISDADKCAYSDKYKVIYFIEDDELYYATTSSKSKKQVIGETVDDIISMSGVTLFGYEDEDDNYFIYRMTGKSKYEVLVEQ